jgi:predicted nucleic acid-binding protein
LIEKIIYLDANVYIELWENKHSSHGRLLWEIIVRGSQNGWRFVSSELTLAEVLVKPIRIAKASGDWSLADNYRFQICDKGAFQHIAPVSRDILYMAANVRSENSSIRLPDAIHLATALLNRCTIFISNDNAFASAIKAALVPKRIAAVLCFSELAEAEVLK